MVLPIGHQGHIQLSSGDFPLQIDAVVLVENHIHRRGLLPEELHSLGEEVAAPEGADAEVDAALHRGIQVRQLLADLVVLQQHLAGIAQKQLPRRCGPHAAGGAPEELHPQLRLIAADELAQAGLGQIQPVRSLADAALLRHRNDIFQFLQFHSCLLYGLHSF